MLLSELGLLEYFQLSEQLRLYRKEHFRLGRPK
jgi:hypothetical protein